MRRKRPRVEMPLLENGTAMDYIEDYRVKKLKRYTSRWAVDAGDLIADGAVVGKLDMSKSRYHFKNRKYGQVYYAFVDGKYHIFRECNRVGYVAPAAHTLSKMPLAADEREEDE